MLIYGLNIHVYVCQSARSVPWYGAGGGSGGGGSWVGEWVPDDLISMLATMTIMKAKRVMTVLRIFSHFTSSTSVRRSLTLTMTLLSNSCNKTLSEGHVV